MNCRSMQSWADARCNLLHIHNILASGIWCVETAQGSVRLDCTKFPESMPAASATLSQIWSHSQWQTPSRSSTIGTAATVPGSKAVSSRTADQHIAAMESCTSVLPSSVATASFNTYPQKIPSERLCPTSLADTLPYALSGDLLVNFVIATSSACDVHALLTPSQPAVVRCCRIETAASEKPASTLRWYPRLLL